MDKKFKETNILEDYSKILAKNCITLGPSITPMVARKQLITIAREMMPSIMLSTLPIRINNARDNSKNIIGIRIKAIMFNIEDPVIWPQITNGIRVSLIIHWADIMEKAPA